MGQLLTVGDSLRTCPLTCEDSVRSVGPFRADSPVFISVYSPRLIGC